MFGLDGRRLYLREMHAVLNSLIQGAAAVLMKQATVDLNARLPDDCFQVCHQHDEVQVETPESEAELVKSIALECFENAGKPFNFRCPLAADVKIGRTWAETH